MKLWMLVMIAASTTFAQSFVDLSRRSTGNGVGNDFKVGQFEYLSKNNIWILKTHGRILGVKKFDQVEKYLDIESRVQGNSIMIESLRYEKIDPFKIIDFKKKIDLSLDVEDMDL